MAPREIIFYAPLGRNIPPEKRGGGETGCNKTLAIYERAGVKVHIVEKAMRTGGTAAYAAGVARTYAQFIFQCLAHPKALVHVVGFYGKVLPIEQLFVRTAQMLGHKTVYEMRNGSLVDLYNEGTDAYRKRQRALWSTADGLLCQGKKFVDFIQATIGKPSFLYPNYLPAGHKVDITDRYSATELKLVFFGRLVPSKNVAMLIEATALIRKQFPWAVLHLIGGINDDYKGQMKKLISTLGMPEEAVVFHGPQKFDYIAHMLRESHFFLFPSAEKHEGHSNSLTEAMGMGTVPVASTAGFNEDIVGDPDLILPELTPEAIALRVQLLWKPDVWVKKSRQVAQRVAEHFTEEIVGPRLLDYLASVEHSNKD